MSERLQHPRRLDADRPARIAAMRAAGMTLQEIADHVGVSKGRIMQLAASAPPTREQLIAAERFPGLTLGLALRLAQRFPDEGALHDATDTELLSMRGMGPIHFARLRARYPFHDEPVVQTPGDGGLGGPAER